MTDGTKITRRSFIYSLVGLPLFLLPPFCKIYLKQETEKKREDEFYKLSCFLTGFDELDRTMNRCVLLEMNQLLSVDKVDKILEHFSVEKEQTFSEGASPELKFFQEKLLRTWYSGNFSLKAPMEHLVALGYLNNLTWASYAIPAPGIPLLDWGKPILS